MSNYEAILPKFPLLKTFDQVSINVLFVNPTIQNTKMQKMTGKKSVYNYKIQQILVQKIEYTSIICSYIQLQKSKNDEVGGFSNFHIFQTNFRPATKSLVCTTSNRNLHPGVAVLHLALQLWFSFWTLHNFSPSVHVLVQTRSVTSSCQVAVTSLQAAGSATVHHYSGEPDLVNGSLRATRLQHRRVSPNHAIYFTECN